MEEQDRAPGFRAWLWPTMSGMARVVCLEGSKADRDTESCRTWPRVGTLTHARAAIAGGDKSPARSFFRRYQVLFAEVPGDPPCVFQLRHLTHLIGQGVFRDRHCYVTLIQRAAPHGRFADPKPNAVASVS